MSDFIPDIMVWSGRATKERFGRGFYKFFTTCAEVYQVRTPTTVLTRLYTITLNAHLYSAKHVTLLRILTPCATMCTLNTLLNPHHH